MRAGLGDKHYKDLENKCMEDHSKPTARDDLERSWTEWMKVSYRVALAKKGRRSDPRAHAMFPHITAPDPTGRRTAISKEAAAAVGLED